MSDEKKTVTIEFIAEASKFKDELKKVNSVNSDFSKAQQKLRKAGIKEDKDLAKISKEVAKFNSNYGKDALNQEKKLLAAMKERSKILQQLSKGGKRDSDELKAQRAELGQMAKQYASIKKQRVEMIGLTRKERQEQDGGPGLMSRMAGLGKWGLLAAGGAALGAVTSRVSSASDAAANYRTNLMGLAGDRSAAFDHVGWRRRGKDLGFGPEETIQDATRLNRLTGFGGNINKAQEFARAGMLDMGQAANFFGVQARSNNSLADTGKNPAKANRELERILASAFSTGLERGRFGEFLDGVQSFMEGAASRTAGDVAGSSYAGLLAALGSTGKSGLMGARGANVLQQLEQGVMKPGGGEAGQALVLRSKGFGTPGGNTSYYDALKRQQRGFTGEKGADELAAFVRQVQSEYGGNTESARLATSNMTGLSLDIVEEVFKAVGDLKGGAKLNEKIAKLTEGEESLEEQTLAIIKSDLAKQSIRQSGLQETLVTQGEQVIDSTQKVADILNDAMNKVWPTVAKTLEFIADVLSNTYEFWKSSSLANIFKDESAAKRAEETRNFRTFINKGEAGLVNNYEQTLKSHHKSYSDWYRKKFNTLSPEEREQSNTILSMYDEAEKSLSKRKEILAEDAKRAEEADRKKVERTAATAAVLKVEVTNPEHIGEATADATLKKQKVAKPAVTTVVPVSTPFSGRQ